MRGQVSLHGAWILRETRFVGSLILLSGAVLVFSNTYLLTIQLAHLSLGFAEGTIRKIAIVSGVFSSLFYIGLVGLFGACVFITCSILLNPVGKGTYWDFFWLLSIAQAPVLVGLFSSWLALMIHPIDLLPSPPSQVFLSEHLRSQLETAAPYRAVRLINTGANILTICGSILCTRYFFRISWKQAGSVVIALAALYIWISLRAKI